MSSQSINAHYLYLMKKQKEEWFASWFDTSYYHLLYRNRNEKEAYHFIEGLINSLQPAHGCRMLDLACGKGRHAIQLSQYGFDVTGIDLSESSIQEALTNSNEQLHFYRHDMRMPHHINYYDWVFNFFTSFGYFENVREHLQTLQSIHASLKKDGKLIIDYLNPAYTLKQLVPQETLIHDTVTFKIQRFADSRFIHKHITVIDPAFAEPLEFHEKVSRLSMEDFIHLFAQSGFRLIQCWGSYQLDAFDVNESRRMIMMAEKVNP